MTHISSYLLAGVLALASAPATAHDIYTGVRGKNSQLCCGGDDCQATTYRESGGAFEFLTREKRWVAIPADRITFLPIPGDPPSDETHHAHLCYRHVTDYDIGDPARMQSVFGQGDDAIYLYCAFIPPGGV